MLTSRITVGENRMLPLWRSVFALVGLLTPLDFVWLLYVTYNSQMNKEKKCWNGVGCTL